MTCWCLNAGRSRSGWARVGWQAASGRGTSRWRRCSPEGLRAPHTPRPGCLWDAHDTTTAPRTSQPSGMSPMTLAYRVMHRDLINQVTKVIPFYGIVFLFHHHHHHHNSPYLSSAGWRRDDKSGGSVMVVFWEGGLFATIDKYGLNDVFLIKCYKLMQILLKVPKFVVFQNF